MDAYFDMFSGISGNMVLGALFDLGLDKEKLEEELSSLHLHDEYNIKVKSVTKEGIGAKYVEVELLNNHSHDDEHGTEHNHEHHHGTEHNHEHHHGRNLSSIKDIINESSLSNKIKQTSISIFENLAEAEAKIHGKDIDEIHFHEVGAVDAVVDIVGSVIGLDMLGIDRIYASRIHTGTGFVNCAHGKMPVPAPATMELLKEVPIYSTGIESELVTPTGAAIITSLAENFSNRPDMKVKRTGYGAGSHELEIPNLLRINTGTLLNEKKKI